LTTPGTPPGGHRLTVLSGREHRAVDGLTGQIAREELGAVRGMRGEAVGTGAARIEGQHHMIPGRNPGNPRTNGLDDAGALVAEDHRLADQFGAAEQVGVAQAGSGDLDQDLTRSRVVQVDRAHTVGLVSSVQHGRGDPHKSHPFRV
jgi:hypothetical protein